MTKVMSSKLKAIIDPSRYGLTVIDQVFGVYRPRMNQDILLEGELVKDRKGQVHRFVYKQGVHIFVESV
jgi:hypothetical protein|tara:strand:+ start:311 stop:517 length:207 start_codon:yes stop_codon:yes gene_type:complete